MVKLAICNYKE